MSSHRPRFPNHIIPHDWDFGQLIDAALEDDGDPMEKLFLHIYETGLKKWLNCFLVLKGKSIPAVISAPQNAFSELKQLLKDDLRGAGENGEQGIELKKVPLPFISCDMGSITPRYGNNVNLPIRNMEFIDSSTGKGKEFKRGVTYSRYPKPLDISYTIDIWARWKPHAAWIAQKFEEQFWNYIAYQDIRLPFGDHSESCMLMPIRKVGSMKNLSNLERGDNEDLLIRYQFDVVVEAWQFFDVERAPTLQIIDTAICDGSEDSFPIAVGNEILTGLAPIPLDEQEHNFPAQSDTVEIWPDSSSSESSSSSSLSSVNSSSSTSSSESSASSSSSSESSYSSSSTSSWSSSSTSSISSASSMSMPPMMGGGGGD